MKTYQKIKELMEKEVSTEEEKKIKSIHVCSDFVPGKKINCIVNEDTTISIKKMIWGITPSWNTKVQITNTRAENIFSKQYNKSLIMQNRCVIIIKAYIEKKINSISNEEYVIFNNNTFLPVAGIYDTIKSTGLCIWKNNVLQCSMITKMAEKKINHIHHRMPAILPINSIDIWLSKKSTAIEIKKIITDMRIQNNDMSFYKIRGRK